jgi:hypothetical protein
MRYRLKIRLLSSDLFCRIAEKAKTILGIGAGCGDVPDALKESLVRRYAPQRSFADIGCMWRVNGAYAFLAEKVGAVSVAAVDVYPRTPEYTEHERMVDSRVEFIQGDIHDPDTTEAIGQRDVVFCSGLLYHTPNPIDTLHRLRVICSDILILNTSTVPEMPGLKNVAVFYPFLEEDQRRLWARGNGAVGLSTPYQPSQGYANWFWGFSHSCLESMLRCAGFRVIERYGSGFLSCVVCKVIEEGFVAVSGDWTTSPNAKRPLYDGIGPRIAGRLEQFEAPVRGRMPPSRKMSWKACFEAP